MDRLHGYQYIILSPNRTFRISINKFTREAYTSKRPASQPVELIIFILEVEYNVFTNGTVDYY